MAKTDGPKRSTAPKKRGVVRDKPIRNLATKAGLPLLGSDAYEPVRAEVNAILSRLISDCLIYTVASRRRTVLQKDVRKALADSNTPIYGFK